jgi:hypothetical protein
MPAPVTRCLPLLLVTGLFLCCSQARPVSAPTPVEDQERCGPAISKDAIEAVAKRVLRAEWGNDNLSSYRVTIRNQGCDYVFAAVRTDTKAAEDIVIVMDRQGRVRSFPACCYLKECPDLCAAHD